MTHPFDTDVLVVGAGPVGMAAAIELGIRGHKVQLIERDPTRGPQPRAKTLNMRSLEHMRRWGIADAVRARSPLPVGYPTDIVFTTRLFGHHIATLPNIYFRGNVCAQDSRFSEPSEWIPQYLVEQAMRERIEDLSNVDRRYATELLSFEQDDAGVTAHVRDEHGERTVRARYLIGADGARSRVREALGIEMRGRYAYSCNFNIVLRIPELTATPPEPRGIMYWTLNADAPGVIGPMGDLWYAAIRLPSGRTTIEEDEIRAFITATIGREMAFEIVMVDPWFAHELIATRYREARIFLMGDSCHLHPPFGGYGMNMGIGDAVDLGWKLSAVLAGWGGEGLLTSYEFERRRVHQWTIDESVRNYSVLSEDLVQPDLETDGPVGDAARASVADKVIEQKRREFHTIGLVLGYHYAGSPIIAGKDALPPPSAEDYLPVAAPGTLAPHVWLDDCVSLYDRFGPGLTLIVRSRQDQAADIFRESAARLAIPLNLLTLPDLSGDLYPATLTLIRPDEHVSWTGEHVDAASADMILATTAGRTRVSDQ